MSLVLLEGAIPPVRESALPAESRDEPQLFERSEVRKRGRRSHPESRSDSFETRTPRIGLPHGDDPKGLNLSMGQLLESLHIRKEFPRVYISNPNY